MPICRMAVSSITAIAVHRKPDRGFYRLTDDGTALICEEFYFVKILDGDESDVTVYYNTTGSWDIEDSQETDMPLSGSGRGSRNMRIYL